ncbi:ribonuclease pancreatic [Discoglossus pictus]
MPQVLPLLLTLGILFVLTSLSKSQDYEIFKRKHMVYPNDISCNEMMKKQNTKNKCKSINTFIHTKTEEAILEICKGRNTNAKSLDGNEEIYQQFIQTYKPKGECYWFDDKFGHIDTCRLEVMQKKRSLITSLDWWKCSRVCCIEIQTVALKLQSAGKSYWHDA